MPFNYEGRKSMLMLQLQFAGVMAGIVTWVMAGSALADACAPGSHKEIVANGTIRFVRTIAKPIVVDDTNPLQGEVSITDEYELSNPDWPCGSSPIRVLLSRGDYQSVPCPDGTRARVSGFIETDSADGRTYLSVLVPSDISCVRSNVVDPR
ncbi:MAG: hypothetical protein GC190_11890 [Alphaproteobacteria bacterium]|nr:hypothetical protein [Alphaproteobacteria bacterium]